MAYNVEGLHFQRKNLIKSFHCICHFYFCLKKLKKLVQFFFNWGKKDLSALNVIIPNVKEDLL